MSTNPIPGTEVEIDPLDVPFATLKKFRMTNVGPTKYNGTIVCRTPRDVIDGIGKYFGPRDKFEVFYDDKIGTIQLNGEKAGDLVIQ